MASASTASARRYAREELGGALRESRARLLALVQDLDDAQWRMPFRRGLNPVAWEIAHVAWFAEFWILRGPHRFGDDGLVYAARPPLHAGPDAVLDSARLSHAARWTASRPSRGEAFGMLDAQLAACLATLVASSGDDASLYFHRLSLFHEDMHCEALAWMRAALGYPAPAGAELPRLAPMAPVQVPAGEVRIGWPAQEPGFAFDNELPGRRVALDAFEIDVAPVTAGEYLRFVEAGGYDNPAFWPGAAGHWRAAAGRRHPERWRRAASGWEMRWFDRWLPLDPLQPVIHVNAWEAEAWGLWKGRRLPRAAEWEAAATMLQWGCSVWEWTADPFEPYPGFAPGPYRDYSQPWFSSHRELRGGAFATNSRMRHPRYRNFFEPDRTDVFAGFRTAG
ncbi:MAG TPA: selenoneine synthase SenA [Burkholderiales bacterium]